MQPAISDSRHSQDLALGSASNKVLRNTYLMLALTMVPTAMGAWLGMAMKFSMSPLWGFLLFMGISFGFFYAIEKTKQSVVGIGLLLLYTGFMGLWMSQYLQFALRFSNGATMIALAAGGTGAIFATLASIATFTRRDFSFLGKFLMIGLVLVVLASIANIFFQVPALSLTLSAVCVLLFSLWILYDISNIVRGGETNYVSATLSLYLNLYNLFLNLLSLIMALGGDRD